MRYNTIPDEYTPEEIEATLEGTLSDSVLYWHNGKYTAFMVTPATTWTSCYTMYTGDEAERVFWSRAKVNYKVDSYEFTVDYTLDGDSYEAEQETASIIDGLMRYLHTDDIEQAEYERDKVTFYNASGEVVAKAVAQ